VEVSPHVGVVKGVGRIKTGDHDLADTFNRMGGPIFDQPGKKKLGSAGKERSAEEPHPVHGSDEYPATDSSLCEDGEFAGSLLVGVDKDGTPAGESIVEWKRPQRRRAETI